MLAAVALTPDQEQDSPRFCSFAEVSLVRKGWTLAEDERGGACEAQSNLRMHTTVLNALERDT